MKFQLKILLVLTTLFTFAKTQGSFESKEYPPFDGWNNNRASRDSGVARSLLTRRFPSHYHDGAGSQMSGQDRPNPRLVSSKLMSGPSGIPSSSGKTAFFAFFSDYVWAEIVSSSDAESAGCPPEYENIPVPPDDDKFNSSDYSSQLTIPYLRSTYDDDKTGKSTGRPREQLALVSSTIDGSNIYGESRLWSNQLRLGRVTCPDRTKDSNILAGQVDPQDCRGELASFLDTGKMPLFNHIGMPILNQPSADENDMTSTERLYLTGLKRINENPFLVTMGVIWFRHHNWLARQLREVHSDWSDERVFQEARVRNVAVYQNIIVYEWLPLLMGGTSPITLYEGYKPSASLGVSNLFYSNVPYFTASTTPSGVYRRSRRDSGSGECQFRRTSSLTSSGKVERENLEALRLCNTYWNSKAVLDETDIDEIVLGMSSQIAEQEDMIFVEDIKDYYHGNLGFSRRDAVAETIQRGRDHGLPDYNTIRNELQLSERNNFTDINEDFFKSSSSLEVLAGLDSLYGSIDKLDPFVGAMLETESDGKPGEIFKALLEDQFQRLRDGDRFWFENDRNNLLTPDEIADIRGVKIRDVILRVIPSLNETSDIQPGSLFTALSYSAGDSCFQPNQLESSMMESCTKLKLYDYFTTSRISFALTFAIVGLFTIGCYYFALHLSQQTGKKTKQAKQRNVKKSFKVKETGNLIALEILNTVNETRVIEVELFDPNKILVHDPQKQKVIRIMELSYETPIKVMRSNNGNQDQLVITTNEANSYDLVLSFDSISTREAFFTKFVRFCAQNGFEFAQELLPEVNLLKKAKTKANRDEQLQSFIQLTLSQALDLQPTELSSRLKPEDCAILEQVRLNKEEFASYMKLKEDSLFVEQIFHVADVDGDDTISFNELRDVVVIFTKGSAEEKNKLMFKMYDRDNNGYLDREEFKIMLKSMIDIGTVDIPGDKIEILANEMLAENNLAEKELLDLNDFLTLMNHHRSEIDSANLFENTHFKPAASKKKGRKTKNTRAKESVGMFLSRTKSRNRKVDAKSKSSFVYKQTNSTSPLTAFNKLNEYYSRHIFIVALYIFITIGVFAKAFWAVVSNQGSGLVRMGGLTVAIARASGGALAFNFSTLLLTMCKNTITLLRETFLHRFIPFDSAITMHKIVAWMAMFFTVVHIVAHGVNFYEVSTQSPRDLNCLFPDYWFPSHFIPSFGFWCFQTITGITGVILTLILIVMYIFAFDFCRQAIHYWFRVTHYVGFVLFYFFTVLHGSGMLIQIPSFQLYFLGFAVLYVIDKLYSLSRRRIEIQVLRAELLPSDVTFLEIKRPQNFIYKAGQWVKIACLGISKHEYHPFTISSAPSEETLTLHIRAVGPWTKNIRSLYDPKNLIDKMPPNIYLDGPFGEGHQDWYKYEVAVLIGGGIGVTPFASIIKDLVRVSQSAIKIDCKAVYFIWVTRDQRQYEWLTDIIQQVEAEDTNGLLHTHIFVTQLAQKFDLRTTMLYLCEKRFQKISGKSLFTGLNAVTHFGRPNFTQFLTSVSEKYLSVESFGVFSCGPPPMTKSVDEACFRLNINNANSNAIFKHHYENF